MSGAAGTAYINVVPKFPGFSNAIKSQLAGIDVTKQGEAAGRQFSGGMVKSGAVMGAVSALTTKAIGAISSNLDGAISRLDTLNNYPRVMQSLGYSAQDAQASIDTMSERLKGLPTTLDSMVSTVQGLSVITGDLNLATDAGLALNDMLLASGSNQQVAAAAAEQFRQILSKGRPEMQDWKSLMSAMPGQMDQLAKSMLGAGATTNDLYEALGGGGGEATITMDELLAKIVELDKAGGDGFASFAEQAKTATGGIETSMANVNTAITRGLTDILGVFSDDISAGFKGLSEGISSAFGKAKDVAIALKPAITSIVTAVGDIGPAVLAAVTAFSGFSKLKAAHVAMTEAATAGGIATGIFVGVAAAALLAYDSYTKFNKATSGMTDALRRTAAIDVNASSLSSLSSAADGCSESYLKLTGRMAKRTDKINEVNSSAQAEIASINGAAQVIKKYAGQTELTAQEQGQLNGALQIFNDAMGTSISQSDVAEGSYRDEEGQVRNLKDAVEELTAAKTNQIRQEALGEAYKVALENQADAAQLAAKATREFEIAQADAQKTGNYTYLAIAKEKMDKANQGYYDSVDALQAVEIEMGKVVEVTEGSASSFDTATMSMDLLKATLDTNGSSLDVFKQALENAGVNLDSFSALSESGMVAVASAFIANGGDIEAALGAVGETIDSVNSKPLNDKSATASVSTWSVSNAMSIIDQWNSKPFYGKSAVVAAVVGAEVGAAIANAAGGIRPHAAGGIRYHADGAIATRAVPLDIVGEDGAEAIVPLTNKRYSQPFIDLLAEGIRDKGMGQAAGTVININDARVNGDADIRDALYQMLTTLRRKGMM